MMVFVNGKDDIPYMKWKIKNVPNHQPDISYKVGNDAKLANIFPISLWFMMFMVYNQLRTGGGHIVAYEILIYSFILLG